MKSIHYQSAERKKNPFNANVGILFVDDRTEILHLELKPMQYLAKVKTEFSAFFYILEGNPEVIIGDDSEGFAKDHFIYCPAGSFHCINNPTKEKARILVIKPNYN